MKKMKNPPKVLWVCFSSDGNFIVRGKEGWASDVGEGFVDPVRYVLQRRKPKKRIKDMNGVRLMPKHEEEE